MDIRLPLQSLQQKIQEQAAIIVKLKERISVLENKKNSNKSHIPPSQDQNRLKKNQSLRESPDRKLGGQLGHEGTMVECSIKVDEIITHSPAACSRCCNDLSNHQ